MEGEAIKDKMLRCKTWPFPHSSTQCLKLPRKKSHFYRSERSEHTTFLQIHYFWISYTNFGTFGEACRPMRDARSHFFFQNCVLASSKSFLYISFQRRSKNITFYLLLWFSFLGTCTYITVIQDLV